MYLYTCSFTKKKSMEKINYKKLVDHINKVEEIFFKQFKKINICQLIQKKEVLF